ncbi:hypothetical protein CROQUDRAFT_331080 [Cronartium quercuum f. sp. fusiforme G11]|uniref:Uncharacterized protein n=1 Tax=Cronartium quercuum f. sp. fusiforme G11 TaxID=708437 RepID=A0A9P6NNR4_9BASI|nr:hypothetical protein CROQUDRAFT_331080 [Cronartium quercuum f. sp. fusiforme G11]
MIKGIAEALSVEEQKSKTLASEIDEIQRGNWDDKLKNVAQRKKILHTLGVTQTADSDDVPISRSRSATPSNPAGSVENNTGSAMHSPLGSEPSEQDSRRPTTPNVYLQVPVTCKMTS